MILKIMNTRFAHQLDQERDRFAIRANGVIAAPLAGAIYWAVLSYLGYTASIRAWCIVAFFLSGFIFPLALFLQKPTKSNLMVKDSSLSKPGFYAFANLGFAWPIIIASFQTDSQLVPLALGIAMSLHLTGAAWAMNIKSYLYHPIIRAVLITVLWYALPEFRFTLIPLAISLIYLATIPFVLREVSAKKETHARRQDA